MTQDTRTKFILLVAAIGRREYLPDISKAKTLKQARRITARAHDEHGELARQLVEVYKELNGDSRLINR